MREEAPTLIDRSPAPLTEASLAASLRALGVAPGMVLLVHSSLSALGWVCGGPVAVVLALREVLGPTGTLMMPTHSGDLSEPSHWKHPPVPESWWQVIRDNMPAYDPALTPTRRMGAIVECFRHLPGVLRSSHPQVSFAAHGPQAETLLREHALESGLGEHSPLSALYDLDGWVLLLGVGHSNNTSLHLAEARARLPHGPVVTQGAPMLVGGHRAWVRYTEPDWDDSPFADLGEAFARDTGLERQAPVGLATARLMRQRDLVDYATRWLSARAASAGK